MNSFPGTNDSSIIFEDLGNPFQEDSGELLTLDTQETMNDYVVETTRHFVKTAV